MEDPLGLAGHPSISLPLRANQLELLASRAKPQAPLLGPAPTAQPPPPPAAQEPQALTRTWLGTTAGSAASSLQVDPPWGPPSSIPFTCRAEVAPAAVASPTGVGVPRVGTGRAGLAGLIWATGRRRRWWRQAVDRVVVARGAGGWLAVSGEALSAILINYLPTSGLFAALGVNRSRNTPASVWCWGVCAMSGHSDPSGPCRVTCLWTLRQAGCPLSSASLRGLRDN